jgi:hypothetical protein
VGRVGRPAAARVRPREPGDLHPTAAQGDRRALVQRGLPSWSWRRARRYAGACFAASEAAGKDGEEGQTKSPAGTRWVSLPPGIATAYETLMHAHDSPWVFCTPDRAPLRRSNFRQRCWRPAWDGVRPDEPRHRQHAPAILSDFSFHEGRHSHNTWMTEDGIPEVARRARLGQKMKGIARVYDHVTPAMTEQLLQSLETRWAHSVAALSAAERTQLLLWIQRLRASSAADEDRIAISSPFAS